MFSPFRTAGWESPTWPLMLACFFSIVVYFAWKHLEKCLIRFFPSLEIGDVDLDEDLDNFWKSLDDHDRNWSVKEEENLRDVMPGTKLLLDDAFNRLKTYQKTLGNTLIGVHTYDVLANPLYLDDFQYIDASTEDREKYIIDDDDDEGNDNAQSDLVRAVFCLAYMTKAQADAFAFNKDAMVRFKSDFGVKSLN